MFIRILSLLVSCLILSNVAQAVSTPTAGWLEGAYIDGVKPRLRAKLDSGALTSSIHGTHKRSFMRDGERWLRFEFHWYKSTKDEWFGPFTVEAPMVRRVLIKDHDDESERRPVVNLHFSMNGECHLAEFSVVDRSGFNYPVLLGRRFLAGEFVIDPKKTFTNVTDKYGKSACKKVADKKIEQNVKRAKKLSAEAKASKAKQLLKSTAN